MSKEDEELQRVKNLYAKNAAEKELMRRRLFKLDDESRKIGNMTDAELEDYIKGLEEQTT